jgi:hypothetical protein
MASECPDQGAGDLWADFRSIGATYADIELDENTHTVRRGGRLVELTRTEYVRMTSACIAMFGLVDVVVTRESRLRVRLHDAQRHPSVRWPLAGLPGAIAPGSAATWIALQEVSALSSGICGCIAALRILAFRAKTLDAVRHDIASDGWS